MSTQTYKPISIASSTRELYQKAKDGIPPLDTKTDIKAYFHLAANLYNKAALFHKQGDLESSCIILMRFSVIVEEQIPLHPSFKAITEDLKKKKQEAVKIIAELMVTLKQLYQQKEIEDLKKELEKKQQLENEKKAQIAKEIEMSDDGLDYFDEAPSYMPTYSNSIDSLRSALSGSPARDDHENNPEKMETNSMGGGMLNLDDLRSQLLSMNDEARAEPPKPAKITPETPNNPKNLEKPSQVNEVKEKPAEMKKEEQKGSEGAVEGGEETKKAVQVPSLESLKYIMAWDDDAKRKKEMEAKRIEQDFQKRELERKSVEDSLPVEIIQAGTKSTQLPSFTPIDYSASTIFVRIEDGDKELQKQEENKRQSSSQGYSGSGPGNNNNNYFSPAPMAQNQFHQGPESRFNHFPDAKSVTPPLPSFLAPAPFIPLPKPQLAESPQLIDFNYSNQPSSPPPPNFSLQANPPSSLSYSMQASTPLPAPVRSNPPIPDESNLLDFGKSVSNDSGKGFGNRERPPTSNGLPNDLNNFNSASFIKSHTGEYQLVTPSGQILKLPPGVHLLPENQPIPQAAQIIPFLDGQYQLPDGNVMIPVLSDSNMTQTSANPLPPSSKAIQQDILSDFPIPNPQLQPIPLFLPTTNQASSAVTTPLIPLSPSPSPSPSLASITPAPLSPPKSSTPSTFDALSNGLRNSGNNIRQTAHEAFLNFAAPPPSATTNDVQNQSPPPPSPEIELKSVVIENELFEKFSKHVEYNTARTIETCAILTGEYIEEQELYYATSMIIPKQSGTAESCSITDKDDLLCYLQTNKLSVLGWVVIHPAQRCFLSTFDLHEFVDYQLALPEAVAIVISPRFSPNFGVFRLTTAGMGVVSKCTQTGYHHHSVPFPLFENGEHVVMNKGNNQCKIIDLR